MRTALFLTMSFAVLTAQAGPRSGDPERGRKALEQRSFNPAIWSISGYETLWKLWGYRERPAHFDELVRERYGLHEAPYPNDGLPMGLRKNTGLLGKGISIDCLTCHGGSMMGKSYIGLGNASLDVQALFEELNAVSGIRRPLPFTFTNVRGTSEAGGMGVYLLGLRTPELGFRTQRLDLGLDDQLCEDVPAWWLLKKKKTMYYTGGAHARSVRSLMQFMLGSLNTRSAFDKEEETFRDIQAYLLTLEPPKYPFPIDKNLAAQGKKVFESHCAQCHGTYGPDGHYPNRIVPLDEIGTDTRRFYGISDDFGRYYNRSWFAREKPGWFEDEYAAMPSRGYQAPPLDGIWATAPYLHNGSVPTIYHLLKSESRPRIFTRSYRTQVEDYDPVHLGWKITVLDQPADPSLPPIERRKVYDTSQPGRSNVGHIFGDDLTDAERWAVIEYLKTL
jgi:mono/diheme cytochrome c family protein